MAAPIGHWTWVDRVRPVRLGPMASVDDQRDEYATVVGSFHVEAVTDFHVAVEGGALT